MTDVAPISRTLHDRIFKEFLHRFLPDFLTLFFPEEAARLDFSAVTFLDQELVVNLPGQTLRITDVVAEIATHDGSPEVIIVHLEVEGRDKRAVPQRMFEYYALLRLLRQKEVLPLALLLTPNVGGISWPTYQETLFGRQLVTFHYGQVGLRDLPSEAYLRANPVAAALAALMQPERESQTAVKLAGLRTVIDSQLTVGDKLFLIDIIETYLPTSALTNAEEEVMEALLQTELTWRERIAQESEFRGKQEGVREGKVDLLQRLLAAKFGRLPANFVRRLQAVEDTAVLDNLSEQLLTAATLDDIKFPDEQA